MMQLAPEEYLEFIIFSPEERVRELLKVAVKPLGRIIRAFSSLKEMTQVMDDARSRMIIFDTLAGGDARVLLLDMLQRFPDAGFVVLLDVRDPALAEEVQRKGALDFISHPLENDRTRTRIRVAQARHERRLQERLYQRALEGRLFRRTEEAHLNRERARQLVINTIRALELSLQAKHPYTEGHSRRVAEKAVDLAKAMGITGEELRNIEVAALFHDLGKIGIRDEVLDKRGSLTEEEFEHIKLHPVIGEQILSQIEEMSAIADLVKHEHERWDGEGYPEGLRGEEIPLGARIIHVADAWDSMLYDRVYREGRSVKDCLDEIRTCSGTQFDPSCVKALLEMERGHMATVERD